MACCMASDRMMQAIGSLERAIARLEQVAATPPPSESPSPPIASPAATAEARAALQSLDLLIADLKAGAREPANG